MFFQVKISGFFAAVASLNIEIMDNITDTDIVKHTNSSYVTIVLQGENYVSIHELRDCLNGQSWRPVGYSALPVQEGGTEEGVVIHELWTKSTRGKKSSIV